VGTSTSYLVAFVAKSVEHSSTATNDSLGFLGSHEESLEMKFIDFMFFQHKAGVFEV
jgi:hypothetical protein